jgi:hypothetical protein
MQLDCVGLYIPEGRSCKVFRNVCNYLPVHIFIHAANLCIVELQFLCSSLIGGIACFRTTVY